uniref:Homeobox domain-containing protein n=1 Tax=Globodera pallida TaxID=36090 RepID=A0A183CBW4_GLOPA
MSADQPPPPNVPWTMHDVTAAQRNILEQKFQCVKYLNMHQIRELPRTLGLTPAQVQQWFEHRRNMWRRMDDRDNPFGNKDPLRRLL